MTEFSKITPVELVGHYAQFVDRQVASLRYDTVSHTVRAALRLLEEREDLIADLRDALDAGHDSGAGEAFEFDAFVAAKSRRS
jgi:antitoxin ParD1/3/4